MQPPPQYNHLFGLTAQIDTYHDWDQVTADEIRQALRWRLRNLSDEELLEAVNLVDTLEPDQ